MGGGRYQTILRKPPGLGLCTGIQKSDRGDEQLQVKGRSEEVGKEEDPGGASRLKH